MIDYDIIYICLGISTALLILKLATGGLKDLITPLCLFYFYFAFGPVINFLFGVSIYFGIPEEYIADASIIFCLALSTLIIGSFIWKAAPITVPEIKCKTLTALIPVYVIFTCYAIYAMTVVSLGGGQNKIEKIALAIPTLHYNYLMIQIYLISFYFLVKETKIEKFYYINLVAYIAYSLVIGERDFIFAFVSIAFHRFLFKPALNRSNLKLVISVVTLVGIATAIFFYRDATQSSDGVIGAILNQGSLLFVNTFSLKLLHERIDFFFGFTYLNSIMNLLPSWIYKTDFNTLDWFKNNYAEASTSGYGFGLDAEGFINFSYPGVVITFFFILFFQRKIAKNLNHHPFYIYFSVFFSAFAMYSLRNDSLAFFKGNVYGILFFYLIYVFSWKEDNR